MIPVSIKWKPGFNFTKIFKIIYGSLLIKSTIDRLPYRRKINEHIGIFVHVYVLVRNSLSI